MSSLARKMGRARRREADRRGQAIINRTPLTPLEEHYNREFGLSVSHTRQLRTEERDRGYTGPNKPDKGLKDGSCNRTACQAPGAAWFNHSTRAYYCRPCAHLINAACRQDEFIRNLGHDLCTLDLPVGEVIDPDADVAIHPTATGYRTIPDVEGDDRC